MVSYLYQFWNIVIDVWHKGIMGVDIGHSIVALAIFLGFVIIRKVFTSIIIGRLKTFTANTTNQLDDETLKALEGPIRFIPIVMGVFFAVEYLALQGAIASVFDRLIRTLIIFNIFWAIINLVDPFSFLFKKLEQFFTASMLDWMIKTIKLTIGFIGIASILELWGIKVGPIIAGFGLFGVAVALGAQDLFKNLISGILILAERRFGIGDWIKVEGIVEGTVEAIGFRSTHVRRFDKAPVYVPNAKLSDVSLINFSKMTYRRIYWVVGVEYKTSLDQLREIRDNIESFILAHEGFAKPPMVPAFVRIDKFNQSSIDFMIYCFTKTTDWGKWLVIKEELAYRIKEIIENAGTNFAFPSQSLYLESLPEDRAEIFVPPQMQKSASHASSL